MGFSRQEYWSGLPCLSPGYLPSSGVEPRSPSLLVDSLPSEPPAKPSLGSQFKYSSAMATVSCFPFTVLSTHLHFSAWVSSVQLLSCVRFFVTPWTSARQASLSVTNSQSLLKLMSIESVMPSNHLILYHPLLLPSIFPSIRVFLNESVLRIRWPKYWSFSFNISSANEYSGLISFRMDWLDLLAVQGTLVHTSW